MKPLFKFGNKVIHKDGTKGIVTNIISLPSLNGGGYAVQIDYRFSDVETSYSLYNDPEKQALALAEVKENFRDDMPIYETPYAFPHNHLVCVRGKYADWCQYTGFVKYFTKL